MDTLLKDILSQYNRKKNNAEFEAERRKRELYEKYPKLQDIEDKLSKQAINTTKCLINNNDKSLLEELNTNIDALRQEKLKILKSLKISQDYFEPHYDCAICKDTGYVTNNDYTTSMCSCLKQRLLDISFNKSNMYNLKKENFANFDERLYSDEPDLSKYKLNISPRKNILNIKNKCLEFITHFDDPNYKNLLFTGSTGLR